MAPPAAEDHSRRLLLFVVSYSQWRRDPRRTCHCEERSDAAIFMTERTRRGIAASLALLAMTFSFTWVGCRSAWNAQ
jgi:hypothetical protein